MIRSQMESYNNNINSLFSKTNPIPTLENDVNEMKTAIAQIVQRLNQN